MRTDSKVNHKQTSKHTSADDGIQHTGTDASPKNIYPHQQHTMKKKTFFCTPNIERNCPQNPTVNTIDPGKFRRTAPNQHKSSIRPKPTPETKKKSRVKSKDLSPGTNFGDTNKGALGKNPRTILGRNALEDPPRRNKTIRATDCTRIAMVTTGTEPTGADLHRAKGGG